MKVEAKLRKAFKGATSQETPRITLVRLVRVMGHTRAEAAGLLGMSASWASKWMKRHFGGGIGGLKTSKRSGRPALIPKKEMCRVRAMSRRKKFWTAESFRDAICEKTRVKYHAKHCAAPLRKWGYAMVSVSKHVNAASPGEVKEFQDELAGRMDGLESEGRTVLVQDEAIYVADAVPKRRVYGRKGVRATCVMTGTRQRRIVYGALARDGRQLFRQYGKFDALTLVRYLKEAARRFGKILMIVDRAPQHRANVVKNLLKNRPDIKLMLLPRGSPYLNAVEECWRQSKRDVLAVPFTSDSKMVKSITRYFKARRFNLCIIKYLMRMPHQP